MQAQCLAGAAFFADPASAALSPLSIKLEHCRVAGDATLAVELSDETRAKLVHLAGSTRCTSSALASEAIAAHVDRELAIIDAVDRGRADKRADRVYGTGQVFEDAPTSSRSVAASRSMIPRRRSEWWSGPALRPRAWARCRRGVRAG